jgi:hypothetical protein
LRAEDRAARYTFDRPEADAPATIVAVEDGSIRGFATTGRAGSAGGEEVGDACFPQMRHP